MAAIRLKENVISIIFLLSFFIIFFSLRPFQSFPNRSFLKNKNSASSFSQVKSLINYSHISTKSSLTLNDNDNQNNNQAIFGVVSFGNTAEFTPIITFHNACVTDRSLTFITDQQASELDSSWRACCGNILACPEIVGKHRGFLCGRFGLYSWPTFTVNISQNFANSAMSFMQGSSLLMDLAITNFYQYGHAVSRFVQTSSLDVPLTRVIVNKHFRPPGGLDRGQDETNIAFIYNMTVGNMGVPVMFTAGRPACFSNLIYIPNYERPFYSTRQALRWRQKSASVLGIQWYTCPPGRAVLLQRPNEKLTDRRFVNSEVIDSIAASFGIKRLHRVTIGSINTTAETARLFSTFGLMVTVHSSQLKGLFFASPNAAVIEIGGSHLGMWRLSPFSEGMAELGVHYNLSRFHYANVTLCGSACATDDKNAPITVDGEKFREALASVLQVQRSKCPDVRYDSIENE